MTKGQYHRLFRTQPQAVNPAMPCSGQNNAYSLSCYALWLLQSAIGLLAVRYSVNQLHKARLNLSGFGSAMLEAQPASSHSYANIMSQK